MTTHHFSMAVGHSVMWMGCRLCKEPPVAGHVDHFCDYPKLFRHGHAHTHIHPCAIKPHVNKGFTWRKTQCAQGQPEPATVPSPGRARQGRSDVSAEGERARGVASPARPRSCCRPELGRGQAGPRSAEPAGRLPSPVSRSFSFPCLLTGPLSLTHSLAHSGNTF